MENSVLLGSLIQENELKVIATVGAVMGTKGSVSLSEANLLRTDKALRVVVTNDKNQSFGMICSKQLSEGIRAKQIPLGALHQFPIVEYTTQSGEDVIPMIVMPQGSGAVITLQADKNRKEEFKRVSAYKPEELIAF